MKWIVWSAHGKQKEGNVVSGGNEYDATDFSAHVDEFFNKADAINKYEKKFFEKTCNKWAEREYFREKPGKYVIQNKDKKIKMLKEAF